MPETWLPWSFARGTKFRKGSYEISLVKMVNKEKFEWRCDLVAIQVDNQWISLDPPNPFGTVTEYELNSEEWEKMVKP